MQLLQQNRSSEEVTLETSYSGPILAAILLLRYLNTWREYTLDFWYFRPKNIRWPRVLRFHFVFMTQWFRIMAQYICWRLFFRTSLFRIVSCRFPISWFFSTFSHVYCEYFWENFEFVATQWLILVVCYVVRSWLADFDLNFPIKSDGSNFFI